MANDTQFRQSVGKVDMYSSHLTYKVWERVQLDLETITSRFGVSHGNSAMAPPVNPGGGTDGIMTWRGGSKSDMVLYTLIRNPRTVVKYIHSFNMYIGRSVETGEPWLAPGNSVRLRLEKLQEGRAPYFEIEIVSAPIDSEEATQMIGPFNFNLEDVLISKDPRTHVENIRLNILLDGPNEEQQEDVYVLGGKSGFWAAEAVPPIYYETFPSVYYES